ncbi:hypothetical protein ABMA79_10345 [Halobacteriovorax sp. HFRX-2_2]|uniref:hypothetical protein n=1 Tax=unclassified Halobacteriovorax TaxID=2639665 RepID=UPI0037208975
MKKIFIALAFASITSMGLAQSMTPVYRAFENSNYEKVIELLNSPNYKNFKSAKSPGVRDYLLGISYSRIQEYNKAIDAFNSAIKKGNKASELNYELGQANFAINNLDDAIENFKKSERAKYKVEQSNYYIAYIYQLKEEPKNAKVYFGKLLKNKKTSKEMKQISYFQIANMNLEIARETSRTREIVEKYILPDYYKAIDIDPNSSTADDIDNRIKEIKKEFFLEENKLINGDPLPSERLSLSVEEKITYDNNVTLSDDLPSSTGTNKDSFFSQTRLNIEKAFNFKRRYTITPALELKNTIYTDRVDSEIYSNDSYNITPELDIDFAYRINKKPARLFTNLVYDYQAKDVNAQKSKQFNYRSQQFELGSEMPFFEAGNTTLTFKYQTYSYYTESLDRSSMVVSADQIIKKTYGIFVLLYQFDSSDYANSPNLNTTSHLFRVDYIVPSLFPNTSFNAGLSTNFISYEDAATDATRGLEMTTSLNAKLTRIINRHFSFGFEYIYTNNSSDEDTSNYTAHQTAIDFSYYY